MEMNERARTVLGQIVTLHYQTCEPVGSSKIFKTRVLKVSPATIRNIMLKLEQAGYLTQPHTSAGRLPTDLGYRTYVNDISFNARPLIKEQKTQLINAIDALELAGKGPLEAVANYLHHATGLLTFAIPFRDSGIRLKHVHFERLNSERLLVLWIGSGGQPYQTTIQISEDDLSNSMLEKAENFFNAAFRGCSLLEIQRQLLRRISVSGDEWDLLLNRAVLIANALTNRARELEDIRFSGVSRLMDMPEFQNMDHLKTVLDLIDESSWMKSKLQRVLDDDKQWIVFNIGKELRDPELEHLTIVFAKFRGHEDWLGIVGFVGPKRLPYLKSLQILSSAREAIAARSA